VNRSRHLRALISSMTGILFSVVLAGESNSYVLLPSHWTPPVNKWNLGGFNASYQATFIQAMDKWNGKSNFSFTNTSVNVSPCDSVSAPDGQSGVRFDANDCSRGFGTNTLAVTWTWRSGSDTLDTDMVYNTKWTWGIHNSPANSTATVDFRRISVHELGHALGLGHETTQSAIMQPIYGDVLGPLTDDINGMIIIYGNSSPPPPSSDDDFLLMVMPSILAAVQGGTPPPPVPNPQWGVFTELCCPSSSDTYKVTQGSQSRSSTAASCSSGATFNGYLNTTPGSKNFSHSLLSGGCGDLFGSSSNNLQSGKRYLWVMDLINDVPTAVLYSQNISSVNANTMSNNLGEIGVLEDMTIEQSNQLILEQSAEGKTKFQSRLRSNALP
jgi:hypothetical protein